MNNAQEVIKIASRIGSEYYDMPITYDDITSDCRKKEFVALRHISMKIIRDTYHLGVVDVGRYFNRNYTTVVTGCQAVVDMITTREDSYCFLFNRVVEELEKKNNETISATIVFPKYSNPVELLETIRVRHGINGYLNAQP